MNKNQVIAKLREHEPELKAAGIIRLAVFGSVVRGDNFPGSDVDLLADFDKSRHLTLLAVGRLESRLADMLGTRVDLSSPEWLKESIRSQVLREAVDAFRDPERHVLERKIHILTEATINTLQIARKLTRRHTGYG